MLILRYNRLITKFATMQPDLFVPSYLKNTYQFELKTSIREIKDGKVLFTDTIFHPQGGGQPKDKGWALINGNKKQILNAVPDKQTGNIWNQLDNCEGILVGDQVNMVIDEQTRVKHAKLHSAGHLIDLAVQKLGFGWETAKGYHFDDGPYVEYKGLNENLEDKARQLNQHLAKILEEDIHTVKQHYSYEEAVDKGLIPKQFKTPLIRIIKFGDNSCPCGGTHIQNVKQIKRLQITKLQKKGKFLRANYVVE